MDSADAIIAKWKALALHPLQNKWTITDAILAVVIATTIAALWTRVLHEIASTETVENIRHAILKG